MAAGPGWYPNGNVMRYWDGMEWGEQSRPMAAADDQQSGPGALVWVGYVLAVLMPLIGFILGIVVATRPSKATSKHGVWIIVLSIVAFIVWLAIIIHGAQTSLNCTDQLGNAVACA
jgi:uncharacterized membrane protein YhaH (DUF805 family)